MTTQGMAPIADDLLLLLLDERSGRFPGNRPLDGMIAGTLLLELARGNRLDASEGERRIFVEDATPTGIPALDATLEAVGELEGSTLQDALGALADGRHAEAVRRLVDAHAVREQKQRRLLGLVSTTTWRLTDHDRVRALHTALEDVLVRGQEPDDRVATIICLLFVLELLDRIVDAEDREAVNHRAVDIVEQVSLTNSLSQALMSGESLLLSATHSLTPVNVIVSQLRD
ncbi:GOLPH3/VPS74 family protein [Prauserella cavernicola]|uniref:GPP34 family phosphoprotein n=1 Tax=Prauserella cavernicola TaxID=2800127 RepID=A0A934V7Z9_9PSEU|nr:GPP34 family phosphoprotein [Prauserella cavernicola]MBK1787228.1 GPP34 family phosphoprotein [Prauserella cavernicola]